MYGTIYNGWSVMCGVYGAGYDGGRCGVYGAIYGGWRVICGVYGAG